MVLEAEYHPTSLRRGKALLKRLNHPGKSILVRVPVERCLDTAIRHEIIKVLRGPPRPSVHPHGRNAEVVRDLDLRNRPIDVEFSLLAIRGHETLMRRETHQRQAKTLCPPLVGHALRPTDEFVLPDLIEKKLDPVESKLICEIDAGIHVPEFVVAKSPERIG